jgi:CDP-diacylglycerol--glycerol-3-phosphate 3-phosphatidyltransferase
MKEYKKQIPNIITLLRIILVPIFIFFAIKKFYLATLLIFAIAALSDTIDGIIARKYQYVSNFGKLFDPLADKILAASALIILTCWGLIYWWLTALILLRDIFMTLLRHFLAKKQVYLAANIYGKLKTTVQFVTIIFAFFYKAFLSESATIENIILIIFGFVTVITWLSAVTYILQIKKRKRKVKG